ncbi:MAG: outer membrane beta-barrel protein [Bauldia sp.]
MLKLALSCVAAACLAAIDAASAADPGPGRPAAPPPFNWTGLYFGIAGGYGWSADRDGDTSLTPTTFDANIFPGIVDKAATALPRTLNSKFQGLLGGGQVGYNAQVGSLVFGAETDFLGGSLKGSDSRTGYTTITLLGTTVLPIDARIENKIDFLGTFRGRLGLDVVQGIMVYGTGGLAYGHVASAADTHDTPSGVFVNPASGSAAATLTGWTVGGGFESAFGLGRNWSVKAEYLYYDLGHLGYSLSAATVTDIETHTGNYGTISTEVDSKVRGSIVRLGLNYRLY